MHRPLLTAVLIVAAPAPADDKKKDEEKIQGTWTVVSMEREGQKFPDDEVKKMKVVIKDDLLTINNGCRDEQARIKLDAKKKPKALDLMAVKDGKEQGAVPGIYEIDGDNLKLCWDKGSTADRPTEFATKKRSSTALMVLKREKKTDK
jgi:uncharacterized protein (TIGR03067 family)